LTGDSDLTVAALRCSLIGATEATGREAEAKFAKQGQWQQIRPRLPDLEHACRRFWPYSRATLN